MRSEHVGATHGAQYTMRDARTSRSEIIVSCSVASPGGPEVLNPEVLDPDPDFVGGEVEISGIPIWPGSGNFPGLRPNLATNPGSGARRTRWGAPPQRPLLTLVGFVPCASKGAWTPWPPIWDNPKRATSSMAHSRMNSADEDEEH